jgi:Arc/MetJ-type ribon-helix-helix transcriptional regulator
MTTKVSEQLEARLGHLVRAGRFASVEAALEASVEALEHEEFEQMPLSDAVWDDVSARLKRNGPYLTAAELRAQMDAFMDEQEKAAARGA